MSGVCILGDKAKAKLDAHGCPTCPHSDVTGPAISGSPSVNVNGLPALRIGDMGIHAACCGTNMWTPIEASARVIVNGQRLVRKGDKTQHCGGTGEMISASGNVHDNSPSFALILEQLAAVAEGMFARDEGMREVLAGNLLRMAYENQMSGDDLDGLTEKLKGADPDTIETMNLLSQHGGLKPYMVQSGTQWIYDHHGQLVGFYRNDNGIHWAWGLDGKKHIVGEDGATSPGDLTDAVMMVAGGGIVAKLGKKGVGLVLAAGAEDAAEEGAATRGLGKLLEKGRSTFKDQVQKARDAIPKNLEDAKARAYNKGVELGNKRPSDGRPGPGPEDAPPATAKEAGKAVAKQVGSEILNAAKKKYLGH
ncbi:MAG TPA: PAAR domain-containing protein [Kofleriaceae bacterium]|jgi:uncharacterized Zn-binding protein involved in type VI secretion